MDGQHRPAIDRHRIHTTIPIREEIHEAPVIHQSQEHTPVSIDQYLENGGLLSGATQVGNISNKLLHTGESARQVDGVAERLEKDLNLGSVREHTHLQSSYFFMTLFRRQDQLLMQPTATARIAVMIVFSCHHMYNP